MKRIIVYTFLVITVSFLSSFTNKKKLRTSEDATAYIYAYKTIKNPTYSQTATVFTPVFAVTVDKDDFGDYAGFANSALEQKLKKYIEGVMGKQLVSPTLTCCYNYEDSRKKAEDKRLEDMADERRKGKEIKHTGVDFGFSWDWKNDMK